MVLRHVAQDVPLVNLVRQPQKSQALKDQSSLHSLASVRDAIWESKRKNGLFFKPCHTIRLKEFSIQ